MRKMLYFLIETLVEQRGPALYVATGEIRETQNGFINTTSSFTLFLPMDQCLCAGAQQ
jgi:hypothetical protein